MPGHANWTTVAILVYLIVQIALPIRHHFIGSDVLWTEEGHRLSWRMMLRSRAGTIRFRVVNKKTKAITRVNMNDYLTKKQRRKVACYPDFAWQFAQYLKKEYAQKGEDIAVYVTSKAKVNQGEYAPLIDPKVDLASVKWHHIKPNPWVLPYPSKTQK